MKLSIGDKAPGFALADQAGEIHRLEDHKGQWVLLFFYPKDDTPGCTKEACSMRDRLPDFKKLKVQVFGISVDPVKSHGKFAKKYDLNYPILSDENKNVVAAYDVWGKKKFMGREYLGTYRVSFLIDPKGKISKIYDPVKPELHAEEVLVDLRVERDL